MYVCTYVSMSWYRPPPPLPPLLPPLPPPLAVLLATHQLVPRWPGGGDGGGEREGQRSDAHAKITSGARRRGKTFIICREKTQLCLV